MPETIPKVTNNNFIYVDYSVSKNDGDTWRVGCHATQLIDEPFHFSICLSSQAIVQVVLPCGHHQLWLFSMQLRFSFNSVVALISNFLNDLRSAIQNQPECVAFEIEPLNGLVCVVRNDPEIAKVVLVCVKSSAIAFARWPAICLQFTNGLNLKMHASHYCERRINFGHNVQDEKLLFISPPDSWTAKFLKENWHWAWAKNPALLPRVANIRTISASSPRIHSFRAELSRIYRRTWRRTALLRDFDRNSDLLDSPRPPYWENPCTIVHSKIISSESVTTGCSR